MRTATVFDPRYFYHARPTVESTQIAHIEVFEPTGAHADWTPGTGPGAGMNNPWNLVWRGQGRIQPNKDWRARAREAAGEFTATHAVRIQLGIGKNEFGAVLDDDDNIVTYGADPAFALGWRVHVVEVPISGAENLIDKDYIVRNAIVSSNTWSYRLLCDTDTY